MARRPTRPRETLVLRRPAQLRALRDPVRERILRALEQAGPLPVRALAERIGRAPESLYYHVRALVRAGFLRTEGKAPSGRRHHVVYGVTYDDLFIDQSQRSPAFFEALREHYASRLRRKERDIERSLAGDRRLPPDEPRRTGLLQVDVRLTKRGLERFRRRALEFLDELEGDDDADGEAMGVTIAFASLEEPDQ
ncbi:MAG: helix-turn-helix domain-containing protein [Planctomycetota bacterium]